MRKPKSELNIEENENSFSQNEFEENAITETENGLAEDGNGEEELIVGSKKGGWRGFIIFCAVLVAIYAVFLILNIFVFMIIEVSGESMENTVSNGDYVFVNKKAKADYGDIVIISGEKDNDEYLIKRVIAKGGDELKFENGKVYLKKCGEIDFSLLQEDYIKEQDSTYKDVFDENPNPVIIAIEYGELFYMGDNRRNSSDSRGIFSTCREDQIEGVVPNWAVKMRGFTAFLVKFYSKKSTTE